jgi:hypothetical protein
MNKPSIIYNFIENQCDNLGVDKKRYVTGNSAVAGFGETVFTYEDGWWLIFDEERGSRFDICKFQSAMDATRYFFLKLCVGFDSGEIPKIPYNEFPEGFN